MKNLIKKPALICIFSILFLEIPAFAATPEVGPFRMYLRMRHAHGISATRGEGSAYYQSSIIFLNNDLEMNTAIHELYYKIFSLRAKIRQVEDGLNSELSLPKVASIDRGLGFLRVHDRLLNLLLATYALNPHFLLRESADIAPFIKSIKLSEVDSLKTRILYDELLAGKFQNVKSNVSPVAINPLAPIAEPKPEDLFLRPTQWVTFVLELIKSLNAAVDTSNHSQMDELVPEAVLIRDVAVKYLLTLAKDAGSPGNDLIWKSHTEELLSIASIRKQDISWSQIPPYSTDIGAASSKARHDLLLDLGAAFQSKEEEYLTSRLCDQKCIDQASTDPNIRAAQSRRDLLRKKKDLEIQLMIIEVHLYNAYRSLHGGTDDYYAQYAGGRWWPHVIENFMAAKRASAWKAFSEPSPK